jgi:hypothetical protein
MKLRTVIQAIHSIKENISNMDLGAAKKQLDLLVKSLEKEGIEVTQNVKPEYPVYGDCGGYSTNDDWSEVYEQKYLDQE